MAVRVEGVVQGVGFRPFVYALATGLGLTGLVGNDLDGVFAEVEGPQAAVAEFLRRLERDAPRWPGSSGSPRGTSRRGVNRDSSSPPATARPGCAAPWLYGRRTPPPRPDPRRQGPGRVPPGRPPPPRQPQLQLDSLTSTMILTFTW